MNWLNSEVPRCSDAHLADADGLDAELRHVGLERVEVGGDRGEKGRRSRHARSGRRAA